MSAAPPLSAARDRSRARRREYSAGVKCALAPERIGSNAEAPALISAAPALISAAPALMRAAPQNKFVAPALVKALRADFVLEPEGKYIYELYMRTHDEGERIAVSH